MRQHAASSLLREIMSKNKKVTSLKNEKKEFSKINETKIHKNSFQIIKKIFKKKYPKLSIELKIISLNSKVETFR